MISTLICLVVLIVVAAEARRVPVKNQFKPHAVETKNALKARADSKEEHPQLQVISAQEQGELQLQRDENGEVKKITKIPVSSWRSAEQEALAAAHAAAQQ